jgi:hypothetical protein
MRKHFFTIFATACFIISIFCFCNGPKIQHNQLSEQEKKEGWILLFDGNSTVGWHLYNGGAMNSHWLAKNGELSCNTDYHLEHRDIISDKEFQNFDLSFEWKISTGGNSGVFIDVQERNDIPTTWASGPEYQLLEVSNHDYAEPNKRTGCMFGFAPPLNPAYQNPAGQWNQSRIKQVNGQVEFYLNGVLTAREDLGSKTWQDSVSHSNFKRFPEFGKHTKGHIGLQYWLKGVSFRDIKIREL